MTMGTELGGQGTSEDRLSRLEAALDAQQRQIDQLRVENQVLRREALVRSAPTSVEPSSAEAGDDVAPGSLGRRSLLTKGLAAAGAATAGAIMLGAEPAAAADGQPLLLGRINSPDHITIIDGTFQATNMSAQGIGLLGLSYYGVGVWGETLHASGVGVDAKGHADGSIALRATGSRAFVATSTNTRADSYAVDVTHPNGAGVSSVGKTYGVAAAGTGPTGVGVYGFGPTGLKGAGTTASGIGVLAESQTGGGAEVRAKTFHLRLRPLAAGRNAPTGDTFAHVAGDLVETTAGELWVCTTAGTPGTWRKLAGPNTAGAFHVLPVPARVYDSRPGLAPTAVGPKTPFAAGSTRTFDLKVNSSLVPAGATAAMVTLLLVNAASANGNLTIWANGAAKPVANTLVWGGSAGRFTATAVTALDAQARVQVNASARTDLVIDVVGFYR